MMNEVKLFFRVQYFMASETDAMLPFAFQIKGINLDCFVAAKPNRVN